MDQEYLKNEYILQSSEYDDAKKYNGLLALAFQIQRLIFIDPGTYPNHPKMGVGIRSYQFEKLNNSTLSQIRNKITEQINKYITPDSDINIKVTIEPYNKDNSSKVINSIVIRFELSKKIQGSNDFIIVFKQSPIVSKKIDSEVYI